MKGFLRAFDHAHLEHAFGGPIAPTPRGRDAIVEALMHARLGPEDHIWVLTSSGSRCVSPCVRWALGRWKWGREPEPATRAVLLIHEWGIPHPRTAAIASECDAHGWTLIEDCAHALSTALWSGAVGKHGAWAIYSLPKFTDIPSGGLLRGPRDWTGAMLPTAWNTAFANLLGEIDRHALIRRARWDMLTQVAARYGGRPVLPLPSNAVPWKLPLHVSRIQAVAMAARRHGWDVETCVHTRSVLFPCAPNIPPDERDLEALLAAHMKDGVSPPVRRQRGDTNRSVPLIAGSLADTYGQAHVLTSPLAAGVRRKTTFSCASPIQA